MSDDPFSDIVEGCGNIIRRIEDYGISSTVCEDVGDLERCHDALAREVVNLASMMQLAASAIEARRAETTQIGSVEDESAVAKRDAQK